MRDDTFDPAPAPAHVVEEGKAVMKAAQQKGLFVRVPYEWADRLNGAKYTATLKIALYLLRREFKEHGTVRLPNSAFKGLTSKQKWRALNELERLGLVKVERRPRKSPLVALLYPKD
jgi:hypothetical protein